MDGPNQLLEHPELALFERGDLEPS